jgi:hypothetical protein
LNYLIKQEAWERYLAKTKVSPTAPRPEKPQPVVAEDPHGRLRLAYPHWFWRPDDLELVEEEDVPEADEWIDFALPPEDFDTLEKIAAERKILLAKVFVEGLSQYAQDCRDGSLWRKALPGGDDKPSWWSSATLSRQVLWVFATLDKPLTAHDVSGLIDGNNHNSIRCTISHLGRQCKLRRAGTTPSPHGGPSRALWETNPA